MRDAKRPHASNFWDKSLSLNKLLYGYDANDAILAVRQVAWKILEAYPQQMKAIRSEDDQLPSARATLADALIHHGHLEVRLSTIQLVATTKCIRRRHETRQSYRVPPTGSERRRRQ